VGASFSLSKEEGERRMKKILAEIGESQFLGKRGAVNQQSFALKVTRSEGGTKGPIKKRGSKARCSILPMCEWGALTGLVFENKPK